MTTDDIRDRIKGLGWRLQEIPIRRNNPEKTQRVVAQWKLIASKGERSLEVSGKTIDEAVKTMGKTMGVIPQKD